MTAIAKLQIWDRANTTKLAEFWATDADGFQRNFDSTRDTGEKLGESGSGNVTLQADHPAAAYCVPGNVVRLCAQVGETVTPLWAWTIRDADETVVTVKHSDETINPSGDGLLERWADATVAPWIEGRPISLDRIWNWAAPRGFDDSGWSTTKYFQDRSTVYPRWPTMYPVAQMYAGMLWSSASSVTHPPGSVLFRVAIEPEAACDVVAFHSADDAANAWCDGVLLNRHSVIYPDRSAWEKTWREVPSLSAGEHVFAYEAVNLAVGGAYFMCTIMEASDGVVVGEPFASTGDDQWRWLDVGTGPKPGFTAPAILSMLLTEAQGRGKLSGWSIETHGTFDEIEEFSCRVGTTYREVLDQLMVADIDVAVDTAGLKLHVWPWGERGGTGVFSVAADDVDELSVADSDDVVTAVLAVWGDGATWVSRSAHPVFGRVERSLSLGSVTDPGAVLRIANAYLDAHAEPSRSIVGVVENTDDLVAGLDYRVGDWGSVAGESVRCVGLTYAVERDGRLSPVPEFGSLSSIRRRRFERTVDRLTSQFDSPATASVLTSNRLLVSGYPSSGSWSWSWSGDVDELNDDDPDKPSQVGRVETLSRLWKLEVEIDPDDLPDAWGDTTIRILKNGSLLNALYNVTLSTTVAKASIQIWAYETVNPGDRLQVQAYTQGGHVDGRVTLHYCDAI